MNTTKDTKEVSAQQVAALGYAAFEAVIQEASEDGLRDLHKALEKGKFRTAEGWVRLVQGKWGDLGCAIRPSTSGFGGVRSACVLNALFHREGARYRDKLRATIFISNRAMMKKGYRIGDFCAAWDAGLLDPRELLRRLDRFMTERLVGPA